MDDIIRSGRATYNQHDYQEWHVWFNSSAAVLQLADSNCIQRARASQPGILSFGVTPAILSKTIALEAVRRLLSLHGAEFEILLQAIMLQTYHGDQQSRKEAGWWTEYALYALAACHAELFDQFHQNTGHGVYAENGDTVYHPSQIRHWNTSHVFQEEEQLAPFIFVQSMLSAPVGDLAAQLQDYL